MRAAQDFTGAIAGHDMGRAPRREEAPTDFSPEIEPVKINGQLSHRGRPATTIDNNGDSQIAFRPRAGNDKLIEPAVPVPAKQVEQRRFQVLQQWEGTVFEVGDEDFSVRLRDVLSTATPEQRATLDLEQVSDADLSLVSPGAVFYWTVGYRIEDHGQKSMTSTVKFRRLPGWTKKDLQRAQERAAAFDAVFEADPD